MVEKIRHDSEDEFVVRKLEKKVKSTDDKEKAKSIDDVYVISFAGPGIDKDMVKQLEVSLSAFLDRFLKPTTFIFDFSSVQDTIDPSFALTLKTLQDRFRIDYHTIILTGIADANFIKTLPKEEHFTIVETLEKVMDIAERSPTPLSKLWEREGDLGSRFL